MRKILKVLLIVFLTTCVLIGLTACGDKEKESDKTNNKTDSSSKTSYNNDVDDGKEVIESYINAINDRDLNTIINSVNIKGMNKFAQDVFESDDQITSEQYKENFENFVDIADEKNI